MQPWQEFETKMRAKGLDQIAINAFKHNFEQLVAGVTGLVPESDIDPVENLPRLEDIRSSNAAAGSDTPEVQQLLHQTAVLKLNGGLGTSMGLEKAKSLLNVKDGKTFLDLIAEQIKYIREQYGCNLRFILMNSFSTSEDTKNHLKRTHPELINDADWELMQNSSCKVDAETMMPASYPEAPDMEWAPPGHGDIYPSLLGSGMLDRLLDSGVKYLFVSNSDNLGATLDLDLLSHFVSSGKAFLMEVCERTAGDKKGGHLAQRKSDGRLMLRESAMCPDNDKETFQDIRKHRFFNTNNLWVNLESLKKIMTEAGGFLHLPLIKNKKTVNPRDSSSAAVFQLETAMGSAIECFDNAGAIVVPRSRFAPVKTCNDLFALRSDAYIVTESSTVILSAQNPPLVKLDDRYYKLVDQMESLARSIPSLKQCTSFTVKGPVRFEGEVTIQGDVTLTNSSNRAVILRGRTIADTELNVDEL